MTEKQELMPEFGIEVTRTALDPMVSMIERVAMDPTSDISKLEKMLEMKERIDRKEAETSFNYALASAQAEMPSVIATRPNDQTKSKYADLDAIYAACKPIAAKYGFSFSAVPVSGGADGFLSMRWTLRRGAHKESDTSDVPIDAAGLKGTINKTATHAYGSTTSYGRRYIFCAVFDISIGNDNDAQKTNPPISQGQFVSLRAALDESGMDEIKFHTAFGHRNPTAAHLEEFPADKFDEAMRRLKAYKRKKND